MDPDAGEVLPEPDAGPADSGSHSKDGGKLDAGPTFRQGFADEPCPDASYTFYSPDGGFPDGTVIRGLCIALRQLEGTATIDGKPVVEPVHLSFAGADFKSELDRPADTDGHYTLKVMRSRYERLLYHPTEIHDHAGPKDFGVIDLRNDQKRDLAVKTWTVAGSAFFAGQPWPATTNPPDTTIAVLGDVSQQAWNTNTSGAYSVRLMEGAFIYNVSIPATSLGETEVMAYNVRPWVELTQDMTIDIDIPTSELSGNFTIDGQPFPNRLPSRPDYVLKYVPKGLSEETVATSHEGGISYYSAVVPRGIYSVNLEIAEAVDPSLPSVLLNKQVGVAVDLSKNQSLNFDLKTHKIEGAIALDGVAVTPNPLYTWTMYAYSGNTSTQSWFVAYYDVPFTSSSFSLRALPGNYYLALYVNAAFKSDLAEGWYVVNTSKDVTRDVSMPIDIPTNVVEGTLSIDGNLASAEGTDVGRLIFDGSLGIFRYRVRTTDGKFHMRLPKGKWDISFEPNPDAYPDYAVGTSPLGMSVDLTLEGPQSVNLDYQTIPVAGPLLIAGEVVPDTLGALAEMSLTLRRVGAFNSFTKALSGGRPWYFLRIPKNDYRMTFELKKDVLDGVAYGTAPIGNNLLLDLR